MGGDALSSNIMKQLITSVYELSDQLLENIRLATGGSRGGSSPAAPKSPSRN